MSGSAQATTRSRPALFRALGLQEPPEVVEIGGETFRCREVLKHDSWAASGIYESPTRRAFCKFNRQQGILGLPMGWLGRALAARENGFMARLRGIAGIPMSLGPVSVAGRPLRNAVSRLYVEGHALAADERLDDQFFPRLVALLAALHRRGVAHVDLHKRENILVDESGGPHLIDFQISFALPSRSRLAGFVLGPWLRILQRCDDYHLLKHRLRYRPDQVPFGHAELERLRPFWIRLHRLVAVPFRTLRRRLLVALGIRAPGGRCETEAFPEIAHRPVPAVAVRRAA